MKEGALVVRLEPHESQRIWEGYHLGLYRINCLEGSGIIKLNDYDGNPREFTIKANAACDVLGRPIDVVAGDRGIEIECTRLQPNL